MTKRKKTDPPPPGVEFFYEVEQRTEEWFALRRGVPTASKFSAVMAEGRDGGESLTRAAYLNMLAGEIITGRTAETFRNEAMARGVAMEPVAREHYAKRRFDALKPVGLVRRLLPSGRWIACSPDSQVGDSRGLEIKTMRAEELVALDDKPAGGFPQRFKWQLHGTMLVTGWEAMDLILFYEGATPEQNMAREYTVERDGRLAKQLSDALEVFDYDLQQRVKQWVDRSAKAAGR